MNGQSSNEFFFFCGVEAIFCDFTVNGCRIMHHGPRLLKEYGVGVQELFVSNSFFIRGIGLRDMGKTRRISVTVLLGTLVFLISQSRVPRLKNVEQFLITDAILFHEVLSRFA